MEASPAAAVPIERGKIWTLILVDAFARLSYGLARTPLLPLYAALLGADTALIGLIGAAGPLTGTVFKLPAGVLSDILGRRRMMLLGLGVFAVGPFLYLAAGSGWSLLAVRFFHGLATSLYGPVAMAVVASLAGDRRGEYIAWLSNTKILGKLLGALLGGALLSALIASSSGADLSWSLETLGSWLDGAITGLDKARREHFHTAYLLCGVLGLAALVLGALTLSRVVPGRSQVVGEDHGARRASFRAMHRKFIAGVREIVADRRILLASGCEGVQNMPVGILEHLLPIYAVLVLGFTPLDACLLYASQAITTVAARPLFGRWSDRHGRRGVISAGMVCCAVSIAVLPATPSFWWILACCLVFGLGEALVTAAAAALVTDYCQERSFGAAMGVFGTIKDSGHALGPLLGGALIALFAGPLSDSQARPAAVWPYQLAFAAIGALLLLYTGLFLRSTRPRRTDSGPLDGGPGAVS